VTRAARPDRRVVVTGMGAITPLGPDVAATWAAMVAGRSGVGSITSFDASGLAVRIAAEVEGFDPEAHFGRKEARHIDRFAQLAVVAARQAVAGSGIDLAREPERVGVVFGSGLGGLASIEEGVRVMGARGPGRVSPFVLPMMIANMAAAQVAIDIDARGPISCTVTACAASANAIGDALELVRRGRADVVVAGGAEAGVTPIGIAGFAQMRALSERNDDPERASRPFDRDRDGFVVGEGAAALVLEDLDHARARGATILAEVLGVGASCDAHHITAPRPDGRGAIAAIRSAIADAGIDAGDIGYVNAHGTSTELNDRTEALAIRAVLGTGVPVSSTKSVTGHLLGAAGAIEAIACIQALVTGLLPPTANLDDPDPDCALDHVRGEARQAAVSVAMSNSFGFGGHNVALVFGHTAQL
jgi:3-oxoacyl-[acyl-carrier-protein] synthase II